MPYYRFVFNALLLLLITPGIAAHFRIRIRSPTEYFEPDSYTKVKHDLPATYDSFFKLLQDLEHDELASRYDLAFNLRIKVTSEKNTFYAGGKDITL